MSELRIEQHVNAPPAVVFRHLTETDLWTAWQGRTASIDPRPGGHLSVTMPNGMIAQGEFLELVPDLKVTFTWGWVGHDDLPPGSSTVEILLVDEDGGTRVVLTHRYLPQAEVELHRAGWVHYLPRLAQVATGGDPPPDAGSDV